MAPGKRVCMRKKRRLSETACRILFCAVTVAVLIFCDQLSKHWMMSELVPYQPRVITSVFNVTLAFNQGAAFSFLHDQNGWQRWFFIGLGIVLIALFSYLLCRPRKNAQSPVFYIALSLLLAGAIGNVADRIRFGYVIDFLDFHVKQWHWPVFNLADSYITLGVVLYIALTLLRNADTL
jgi:signal peptidase II